MRKKILITMASALVLMVLAMGLTGCFGGNIENYTITFYVDDVVYETIVITPDTSQITLPKRPTKEGHKFDGWFFDKGTWQMMFTENSLANGMSRSIKLYAKFSVVMHTVTFYADGEEVYSVSVKEGDSIPYGDYAPQKTGYTFIEWSHSSGTLPDVMGKNDISVTAVFSPNTYRIYFDLDNSASMSHSSLRTDNQGKIYLPVTFDAAYSVSNLVPHQKEGQEFAYWKHLYGEYIPTALYKVPGNITLSPAWAKQGTAGLNFQYVSAAGGGYYKVTGYSGTDEDVVIPMKYDDDTNGQHSVTAIQSLGSAAAIKSVEIQNSVTHISSGAFYGCENLKSVIIASSVTTVESDAFPQIDGLNIYCRNSAVPAGWQNNWNGNNNYILNNRQYASKVFNIISPVDIDIEAEFEPVYVMISSDGVTYADIPASDYSVNGYTITIDSDYLLDLEEGRYTVKIFGVLNADITLDVFYDQFSLSYDKHDDANITRTFAGQTLQKLYGAGITAADYTVSGSNLTIKKSYLNSLKAGEYELLLKGTTFEKLIILAVFDSHCKPYNLKIDMDINRPQYTILFDCDCKAPSGFSYAIDGGAFYPLPSGNKISSLTTNTSHELVVRCDYSGSISDPYTLPALTAAQAYINDTFMWNGIAYDRYIADQSEMNIFLAYLAHKGTDETKRDMTDPAKPYGFVEEEVYFSDALKDEFIANGQSVIAGANSSFDFPWSFTTGCSASGNITTVTVTYNSLPEAIYSSGQQALTLTDGTTLATGTRSSSFTNFPINSFTKAQPVSSIQELDSLPYGVKPVFSDTASGQQAQRVYDKALDVCRSYISDTMNDYQKVTAIYEWLGINVTYDYAALEVLELENNIKSFGSLNQAKAYLTQTLNSKSWNPELEAALAAIGNSASTVNELADGVNGIIKSLRVFHLQGIFDEREGVADTRIAVCDGIASAFKLLCLIEGIECCEISGMADVAHAWNKVKIDGKLYVVDATWARTKTADNSFITISRQWLLIDDATALSGDNPHLENAEAGDITATHKINILATEEYDYYAHKSIGGGNDLIADSQQELNAIIAYFYSQGAKTAEFKFNIEGVQEDEAIKTAVWQIKNRSFRYFGPGNDMNVWVVDLSNLYT